MKIPGYLIFGLMLAFLVAGCARKSRSAVPSSVAGVFTYRQDNLYEKYIFEPDWTVTYKSDLEGQFYHTKAGNGVFAIQKNQIVVSLHGMMDFTSPFNFQAVFKKDGKDLVQLYTIDANGQTNMTHQYKYLAENQ